VVAKLTHLQRRIAEQISSDCRSQTKLMDTTLRNLASWCSSFVEGQSPPLPSSSSKYQQRGASIVASFAPRAPPHVPAPSPSRARELALKTGCELLERYQSRLSSMESNLRVLSLSLAAKDARLRNEVALLAAQKSALPAQQDIWSPSPLTIALPPNVEAVLRAAFKRLEKTETPGGVGKVRKRARTYYRNAKDGPSPSDSKRATRGSNAPRATQNAP